MRQRGQGSGDVYKVLIDGVVMVKPEAASSPSIRTMPEATHCPGVPHHETHTHTHGHRYTQTQIHNLLISTSQQLFRCVYAYITLSVSRCMWCEGQYQGPGVAQAWSSSLAGGSGSGMRGVGF